MAYRLLAIRKRYVEHFAQDFPPSVKEWLQEFSDENSLDLTEIYEMDKKDIKSLFVKTNRKMIFTLIGVDIADNISTRKHNLFAIGDDRDNLIIKYYVGISGALGHINRDHKLVYEDCPQCNTRGTQRHFVNDCEKFHNERIKVVEEITNILRANNINIEVDDLHQFIKSYIYDRRLEQIFINMHSYLKKYIYMLSSDVYVILKSLTDQKISIQFCVSKF